MMDTTRTTQYALRRSPGANQLLDVRTVRTTCSPSPLPSPSGRGRRPAPRLASSEDVRSTDAIRSAWASPGVLPFHEPERRTPMRLDGNYFASSRIGVRRSDQVHGPNVRPKLEVEAPHEPERRTPMRLDGNHFVSSRIGVRRSDRVHGP